MLGNKAFLLTLVSHFACLVGTLTFAAEPPKAFNGTLSGNHHDKYVVRTGDELELQFFYNPELNERVVVAPDGRIALQLIGDISASGLALPDLKNTIEAKYQDQLQHPEVNVVVRAFGQERVFVDGEVGHPGMQSIQAGKTLLQAISDAGGAKETGLLKEVKIIRQDSDRKPVVLTANIRDVIRHKDGAEDLQLQPNDIVFVPRSAIANVNTWVDQYLRRNIPITFGLFNNGF